MRRAWISLLVAAGAAGSALGACSGAPAPRPEGARISVAPSRVAAVDPCRVEPGRGPPEPLERLYDGLLERARCRAEVDAIMRGVSQALGVACEHCHLKHDYRAPTEQKTIANWMARVLAPRLALRSGGEVTCADCHAASGHGVARLLGEPRSEARAVEWMNTELVARFTTSDGKPLRCRSCHAASFGARGFQRDLIASSPLDGLPARAGTITPEGDGGAPPAPHAAPPEAGAP